MASLQEVAVEIKNRDNFLILGHIDPDGDCIGSVIACKKILDKLGKKSCVAIHSFPFDKFWFLLAEDWSAGKNLSDFFSGSADYFILEDEKENQDVAIFENYRNVIVLDCGSLDRLGESGKKLSKDKFLINIDHHPDNTGFGNLNLIDAEVAATGELIFLLAEILQCPLNLQAGRAIAAALLSDTGSLRYNNTTVRVFKILTELMELGIDIYRINKYLFANNRFSTVKLKGLALATLSRKKEGKIAWLYVDQEMLNKTAAEESQTGGLVNYARDIQGVEVGLSFVEAEVEHVKISLRSKSDSIAVNQVAAKFNGGGHARAAGCILDLPLKEAINRVLKEVEKIV